jgi:flagellar protein FlaI
MPRLVLRKPSEMQESTDGLRGLRHLLQDERRTRPHFSHCWVTPNPPSGFSVLEEYKVSEATVRLLTDQGGLRVHYHMVPWEYGLPDRLNLLMNAAIEHIVSVPPLNLDQPLTAIREQVQQEALAVIRTNAGRLRVALGSTRDEIDRTTALLAEAVTRHTIGLGVLELLLADRRIEDAFIDAPAERNPIHVTLSGMRGRNEMLRCTTNIIATDREVSAFISRIRFQSGRPFSEAFPTLESDIPGIDARATVIGPPLSPNGPAVALRRHSSQPWTLLRLAANGTIDCQVAGLLSFLIDGRSTLLVCGPRGSGKSSFLGALLFEFPPNQRVLTIEDTPELPVRRMQSLGFKVQSLLIDQRPGTSNETKAEEALRISLRLGESAIVLGEVRGREAKVLYESMRTGKAGSSVLGTIHGESALSVYERVVHDIGIAKEAFMATDAVLVLGLRRPLGSQRPVRRLLELVECRHDLEPGNFRPLLEKGMEGAANGQAAERSALVSKIARSWDLTYDEAKSNIMARSEMKSALLEASARRGESYLAPEWTARANLFFWERVERGERDYARIARDFRAFLTRG